MSVDVRVNGTRVEVTDLTPYTDYTFSVTSENAVSFQATDTSSRTSIASATTLEGGGLVGMCTIPCICRRPLNCQFISIFIELLERDHSCSYTDMKSYIPKDTLYIFHPSQHSLLKYYLSDHNYPTASGFNLSSVLMIEVHICSSTYKKC